MENQTQESKFVATVLSEMNKSDQEKQLEKVKEFQETAVIDAETQIALLQTSELPKAQQKLKKAKNQLSKAEKALEKARFTLAYDYSEYVTNKERAKDSVDSAKQAISEAEKEIEYINEQIAAHEENLADLKS